LLELIVQPIITPAVNFNFDELKVDLKSRLENYQNLVVIEEKIPEYKQDRATLNKLAGALKDEMKRITNEYVIPVNEFKAKINELIDMINEPIKCLDDQLEKFETARKVSKQKEIESFFLSVCNVPGLKLDRFFNEKWLNKTESFKSIQESIQGSIQKVQDEIQSIKDFQSESEDLIIKVYYENFNLSEALKKRQELEYTKKQVLEEQERQKRIAEEKEAKRLQLEASKKEQEEKQRLKEAIADFADVPEFKPETNSAVVSINEPVADINADPNPNPKRWVTLQVLVNSIEVEQLKMIFCVKKIEFKGASKNECSKCKGAIS